MKPTKIVALLMLMMFMGVSAPDGPDGSAARAEAAAADERRKDDDAELVALQAEVHRLHEKLAEMEEQNEGRDERERLFRGVLDEIRSTLRAVGTMMHSASEIDEDDIDT